jgi:acyl carrier protein
MKTFDQLVEEIFKLRPDEIRDELSGANIPEWDSMNYLMFVSKLEEEFNISFTMDEVLSAQTLGDIRKIIVERGKQ